MKISDSILNLFVQLVTSDEFSPLAYFVIDRCGFPIYSVYERLLLYYDFHENYLQRKKGNATLDTISLFHET